MQLTSNDFSSSLLAPHMRCFLDNLGKFQCHEEKRRKKHQENVVSLWKSGE